LFLSFPLGVYSRLVLAHLTLSPEHKRFNELLDLANHLNFKESDRIPQEFLVLCPSRLNLYVVSFLVIVSVVVVVFSLSMISALMISSLGCSLRFGFFFRTFDSFSPEGDNSFSDWSDKVSRGIFIDFRIFEPP
jgi:hypothetical protein